MDNELPKEMLDELWARAEYNSRIPKGFHFTKTDDINKATHWLAYEDDETLVKITPYNFYTLYLDKYNDECFVIEDDGGMSVAYMIHKGDFVVLDKIERV